MSAYYNEFDPKAAAWLREMIRLGEVAPGDVDERSIKDVQPDDLRGYDQCHFFAGIGGWSLAARLAGWRDDRPLWTGSCPCQPFSVAGKGAGVDDPRHLWPDFLRLIAACRPPVVMGEQVAGAAGYGWLDGVLADLAGEDYAGRGVDIPACAVDAPHIRQRLYWIAVDDALGHRSRAAAEQVRAGWGPADVADEPCGLRPVANASGRGPVGRQEQPGGHERDGAAAGRDQGAGRAAERDEGGVALGDAECAGLEGLGGHVDSCGGRSDPDRPASPADVGQRSFWSDCTWIACHDGKARRIPEPGFPLLLDGVQARVAKWRGFGNAIVPPLAAEVIAAFVDSQVDEVEGLFE